MLFAMSGPSAQKVASGDGGGSTTSPVPVSVANFPATQSVVALRPIPITGNVAVTNFPTLQQVAGTVALGNLPAVQSVSGAVTVSNLPTDGSGRLIVSVHGGGSNALILHSTTATYQGDLGGRVGATQRCQSEFHGSHFVSYSELMNAYTGVRGVIWLVDENQVSWMDDLRGGNTNNCLSWRAIDNNGTPMQAYVLPPGGGRDIDPSPVTSAYCTESRPILCGE